MAKIIYGVAGEGFGHSSRSHLIGQKLIDAGHDVIFAASKKSLAYLKPYFGDRVKEVAGLSFAFENGRIDSFKTITLNLGKLPEANGINNILFHEIFKPFDPDLVITDFEPFSAWWAWRKDIPFISIDHEHMLTHCELDHPAQQWLPKLKAEIVTRSYYFNAAAYLVINFFKAEPKSSKTFVTPPIVRSIVRQFEPTEGDDILVYSSMAKDSSELLEAFTQFKDQTFIIYGYDKAEQHGNCIFKKRSTEEFLSNLTNCRGVIASAGFSLLSECLYMRKKMLLMPVANQYEQMINAHYIEKLGLGIATEDLNTQAVSRFLDELDKPLSTADAILWPDNERFFEILRDVLAGLPKPIDLPL